MVDHHLNARAMLVADELAARASALGVCVDVLANGSRVIDAGVKQVGSLNAGVLVARACLADLGTVALVPGRVADLAVPMVQVSIDHPVAACLASQYAGWKIQGGDFFAMGSGPMRAVYGKEALYDQIGWREQPRELVGILESGTLPDLEIVNDICRKCDRSAECMTLIVARTASLAGGIQVVSRSVETAMHKLHELNFDVSHVVGAFGTAPLPPVAQDDLQAIGRTNDAVLYGAEVTLYVTGDDQALAQVGQKLPSSTSKDYGIPFSEIFKRYDHDFYKIDPMLFSPAAVSLQNVQTGWTYAFGAVNHSVLARSFFR